MNKLRSSHLVLVRHGESLWNAKNLWTGWQDIALSPKGRIEARSAAVLLSDIIFDLAFTSDLSRAYETLEIIKNELKLSDLPTVRHRSIKERNYGIYTGKNKWEIRKKLGEEKFFKLRRGWDEPIPQGESLKDVFTRCVPYFLKNIWPKILSGNNVLVVAHGNSNRTIIKHLEGISDLKISEVEMVTGEILIYRFDKSGKIIYQERRKRKSS